MNDDPIRLLDRALEGDDGARKRLTKILERQTSHQGEVSLITVPREKVKVVLLSYPLGATVDRPVFEHLRTCLDEIVDALDLQDASRFIVDSELGLHFLGTECADVERLTQVDP